MKLKSNYFKYILIFLKTKNIVLVNSKNLKNLKSNYKKVNPINLNNIEHLNNQIEKEHDVPFQNELLRNNSLFINSYKEIKSLDLPYISSKTQKNKSNLPTNRKKQVIAKINEKLFDNPFDNIFNDFKMKQIEKKQNFKSLENEREKKYKQEQKLLLKYTFITTSFIKKKNEKIQIKNKINNFNSLKHKIPKITRKKLNTDNF